MAAQCPLCQSKLSWWSMKTSFSCPSCNRELNARVTGPWVGTILLWTIAEVPLYMAIPVAKGPAGIGPILLRSLISIGIAYMIGSLIFGSFGEIRKGRDE
jgi:hypothetical protein